MASKYEPFNSFIHAGLNWNLMGDRLVTIFKREEKNRKV
jgi:hypothetical protein